MTAHVAVPHQIIALCERLDIAAFVDSYIKYLRKQGVNIPNLRIINMRSLDRLSLYLQKLEQLEGFADVQKIILFADAGVKRRITEHFLYKTKRHSFLKDFDYDVYLFPCKSAAGNWTPGFMEDLLLKALKHETSEKSYFYNLHNIAHEYVFSVNNSRCKENHFVNYNRHFLYSYFAGTERLIGLRLGEAATRGAFDLEYEGFKDLREFLTKLEKQE